MKCRFHRRLLRRSSRAPVRCPRGPMWRSDRLQAARPTGLDAWVRTQVRFRRTSRLRPPTRTRGQRAGVDHRRGDSGKGRRQVWFQRSGRLVWSPWSPPWRLERPDLLEWSCGIILTPSAACGEWSSISITVRLALRGFRQLQRHRRDQWDGWVSLSISSMKLQAALHMQMRLTGGRGHEERPY